jgi:hypothetical protein
LRRSARQSAFFGAPNPSHFTTSLLAPANIILGTVYACVLNTRASFYRFGIEKRCYSVAWVLQLIVIAVVVYEVKECTYA